MADTPPAWAQSGTSAWSMFAPARYGYTLADTSIPAARAAAMRCSTSGIRPQFCLPAIFRCQISTGSPARRPMSMASSSASRTWSPSSRMCVA